MKCDIRPIKAGEISGLYPRMNSLAEATRLYPEPLSLKKMTELAENGYVFGAFDNQNLIGYTAGMMLEEGIYGDVGHTYSPIFRPKELVVSSECRNNGLGRNLLLKLKERAYEISEENDTVIDSRFLVNLTNPKLTKFYIDANIKINDYNPKIKGGRGLVNWDGLGGKKLDTEPKSLEEFVEKVKGPIYESKTGIENVLEKERAHEFLLKISDNDQNLNDLFNSIIRDNLYSLTDVFEKDGKFYYRFESPENLHSKANIALKLGNISVMSITSPLKELEDVKALKKIFKLMPNLSYLLDGHRLGFMADMNAVNYYDGLPAESTAWVEKDSESAKKFEEEYGKTAKNLSFLSKKGLTRVDEYMNFDDRLTMAAYGPDALKEIEEIEQMMRQEAAQAAEF